MRFIDEKKLLVLVHSASRDAQHPGYIALQPICDLLEAAVRWLAGSPEHDRSSRTSLPPRA